jgi:hypothetical protein
LGKENLEKNIWPNEESGVWTTGTNQQLMGLCREPDIISEIREER